MLKLAVPQHACSLGKGFQRMGDELSLLIRTSLPLASMSSKKACATPITEKDLSHDVSG